MKALAGIDLGTTYSALAVLDEIGNPRVISNKDGDALTPSAVFLEKGSALVGKEALNQWRFQPKRCVRQIKHHMGESDFSLNLDGKAWTPQEISALILKKLKDDCTAPGREIQDVVITVPASFQEPHRAATAHAGEIAGLNVRALINEPTAAALYYATTQNIQGTVLVYDLGGGTFDATVMRVDGKKVNILASDGNRRLGGTDFDLLLLELIAKRYESLGGGTLLQTSADEANALFQIESSIKRTLSRRTSARDMFGRADPRPIEITRAEFESLISPKIATTEMLVDSAIDQAKLKHSQIDRVLLVGGSTRIPLVSARLERKFGRAPANHVDVDQAVALGAAIQAGLTTTRENPAFVPAPARKNLEQISCQDVAPHSFGTLAIGYDEHTGAEVEKNFIILPKNTAVPCEKTESFLTRHANQTQVEVRVTQGEDEDPKWVRVLHSDPFEMPSGRPPGMELRLTYSYDSSGRMHARILDVASGRTKEFDLSPDSGDGSLSPADRARASAELKGLIIE